MTTPTAIVWTRVLGTCGYEDALALTTGLDGSIFVSGATTVGSLNGQTKNGGADTYLIKLDPPIKLPQRLKSHLTRQPLNS